MFYLQLLCLFKSQIFFCSKQCFAYTFAVLGFIAFCGAVIFTYIKIEKLKEIEINVENTTTLNLGKLQSECKENVTKIFVFLE